MTTINSSFTEDYVLEGEELNIVTYPSPVLKKIARPVEHFDDDLKILCKNMLYTMYKAPGVGLAAPQVGISLRIFVMDVDYKREEVHNSEGDIEYRPSNFNPRIFINPILSNPQGETTHEEGCLSLPGLYEEVKRADTIHVEYQDLDGNKHHLDADELFSICIQHENDHLDGIVFLERLGTLKRGLVKKKYMKARKAK